MQNALGTITVPDDRISRLLGELEFALRQMSAGEIGRLVAVDSSTDFLKSIFRRGKNVVVLIANIHEFSQREVQQAVVAWQGEENYFATHVGEKIGTGLGRIRNFWDSFCKTVTAVRDDPMAETLKLVALALVAITSSGGMDGDGGLPDIDIPLFGIGAHRSPFTHSILIGAGLETLVGTVIRLILATHTKLPKKHDPVWDEFARHGPELLYSISRGVSLGIAYHLLVDGLVQPAPYHGLPIPMPLEVHQAIQAANGFAEGLDSFRRISVQEKTPDIVAVHREQLALNFEVDPALIEWLGPDKTELLEKHGAWMLALSLKEISPYNEQQARFVLVAWQIEPAQTQHELAWLAYINLLRIGLQVQQSNKGIFGRSLDSSISKLKVSYSGG